MLRGILATPASTGGPGVIHLTCTKWRRWGFSGGGAPSWCVSSNTLCQAVGSAHLRTEICCVNPCCPEPCHALPLRPLGELESAGSAAASSTALPHSHTFLFAPGGPSGSFHQLATGSAGELPGSIGLSRRNAGTEG